MMFLITQEDMVEQGAVTWKKGTRDFKGLSVEMF